MRTITGVTFLDVEIKFDGEFERYNYDLGSLRLSSGERSFILDVVESWSDEGAICARVEVDEETFPYGEETNYDLTAQDLMFDNNLKATLYIGDEYEGDEPDSMTLFIQFDGGMVKPINLEID